MGNVTLDYTYRFFFKNGKERDFVIRLDRHSLELIDDRSQQHPDWTRLEFHQCPNCPLTPKDSPHCPVALALYKPIVIFKDFISYEEADVQIETPTRHYMKRTTLHVGLSSMVGIYMVTSGCPVLEKLRPMVRFHLPFADEDETSYRALSMYLMAQFLIQRSGGEPDWDLKGLAKIYEDIMVVNKHFVERLQNMPIKDASLNAIINLDCFAVTISFAITQNMMDELGELFSVYLPKPGGKK